MLHKTKQDVVREFRCAGILDAARRVFARKGFTGAAVDEIAETAGVAKGTVYLYFRSKREIYLQAFKQGLAGLIEETNRNLEAAPCPAAKIKAFIATRVRYAERHCDLISIFHAEFGSLPPASLHKELRALYLRQAKTLEAVLREAGIAGPDSAASAIYDMTLGLICRRMLGWSGRSVEQDIEYLFDLIWRGLSNGCSKHEV